MAKIRLVVSDIDGTLIPEGTNQMPGEVFDVVRDLKKRGIVFAAASGRQYESMLYVFRPVAGDIIFIAENGSVVMNRGRRMAGDLLEPSLAEELVRFLRTIPGGEIMVSTPEGLMLETESGWFSDWLINGYKNKVVWTEDLLTVCRNTNKISICMKGGVKEIAPELERRFGGRMNVMVSGSVWVDFMSQTADKGNALAKIQKQFGISEEETMAFGDNCNDIGLLSHARESYAVANAHPILKEAAKHIAPANTDNGVVRTIREKLFGEPDALPAAEM